MAMRDENQTEAHPLSERSRAFTLTELLVCIGVVVVLISLLLPGLAGARRAAQTTACLSNHAQIAQARDQYASTFRGMIPREGTVPSGLPEEARIHPSWALALRPFTSNHMAPGDEVNDQFKAAAIFRDPARRDVVMPLHYVVNAVPWLSRGVMEPNSVTIPMYRYRRGPTLLERLPYPGATIYATELTSDPKRLLQAEWENLGPSDAERAQLHDVWEMRHLTPGDDLFRIDPARHGSGGNVGFLDGHAATVNTRELLDPVTWDDHDYGHRRTRLPGEAP